MLGGGGGIRNTCTAGRSCHTLHVAHLSRVVAVLQDQHGLPMAPRHNPVTVSWPELPQPHTILTQYCKLNTHDSSAAATATAAAVVTAAAATAAAVVGGSRWGRVTADDGSDAGGGQLL